MEIFKQLPSDLQMMIFEEHYYLKWCKDNPLPFISEIKSISYSNGIGVFSWEDIIKDWYFVNARMIHDNLYGYYWDTGDRSSLGEK